MSQKTTLIAAVAVCAAAGFMMGRISSQHPESADSFAQPSNSAFGPRAGSNQDHPRGNNPRGLRPSGVPLTQKNDPSTLPAKSLDAIATMELIISQHNPLERAESWVRFVKGLNSKEIEKVVMHLDTARVALNFQEHAILLDAWTRHDPYAAVEYAASGKRGYHTRQRVMTSWAAIDPDAAISWAQSHHTNMETNPWMADIVAGAATTDPKLAGQLMESLPYSNGLAGALGILQEHYLKQGPESAREWAMGIKNEQLRAAAVGNIAKKLAQTDPRGAADWLVANPGDTSAEVMPSVMGRMTHADSKSAIAYMENIGDPKLKSRALEGIAYKLVSSDPQATLALIDSHPQLVNDDVVRQLALGAQTKEPSLAAEIITRIEDPAIRNQAYEVFSMRWAQSDPDAALNWMLNQSDLPESARSRAERIIERAQR